MSGDGECPSGDLLTQALSGDRAAFASLVRTHQRTVFSLALRMLADRHAAEDLAQEVFLQLYRNLSAVSSETHLVFWLRKVTLHRAIDRLRRAPRFESVPAEEAAAASESPGSDPILARRLRALVGELPPAARAVVLLRYQEDLDPAEIARTLRMPLNTVKSHLKRSLAHMRERMHETAGALT